MKREPAASSPPPFSFTPLSPVSLPRSPAPLYSRSSFSSRISLFAIPYHASLYPPTTLHGHTERARARSFFSGFHLPASHFLARRYKRPTDRPVSPSCTMENISLAGPISNYYAAPKKTPASERGSGGNLGLSINLYQLTRPDERGKCIRMIHRYEYTCARQGFIHKFQNNHVS